MMLRRIAMAMMIAGSMTGSAAGQVGDCDRECLRGVLTQYLDAVVANQPDAAGIITGYRHTENSVVRPRGEGVWTSVTSLGEVQRHYLDTVTGQAAYFGLVEEAAGPAIVSVRVRVVNRAVAEAEWTIGRAGQPGMAGDPQPDGSGAAPYNPDFFIANPPPVERVVPVAERLSRESLLGVTNSYFDAITTHDPAVMLIHPTCERIENGFRVTGRELPPGSDDGYAGRTNCSSGIRRTGRLNIALVAARRYPVVDEVQQVVLGYGVFVREPTSVNRRLGLSEFFVIDGDRIAAVHAAMFYAAPDIPLPNWPPYEGNWPLPLPQAGQR